MAEGIEVRVGKNGRKSYRASVWSDRDRKLIRKTFPTVAAANRGGQAPGALERGELRRPSGAGSREAAQEWLDGGSHRSDPQSLRRPLQAECDPRLRASTPTAGPAALRPGPRLGSATDGCAGFRRLEMHAERLNPSTIDCTLNPLRAIYRRALARGEVGLNPVRGIELPRGGERRDRIASPEEAAKLLAALPAADRPCGRPRCCGCVGRADGARCRARRSGEWLDSCRAVLG